MRKQSTKKAPAKTSRPKTSHQKGPRSVALVAAVSQAVVSENPVGVLAELARDPRVDVGKMQAIVDLQIKMMAVNAKAEFEAAFHEMHPDLPIIIKHGLIKDNEGGKRGRYARLGEDIQPFINPILKQFGFTLRHRTEYPQEKPGIVRTVGILTHRGGHSEVSHFESAADTSGKKAAIQAVRSAGSYGRRATTIDVLNLVQLDADDDGEATRRTEPRTPPKEDAPVSANADANKAISAEQYEHLARAITRSGRKNREVIMWLKERFGIDEGKAIKRRQYEYVVKCVEHPGPLPLREPGEDG